MTTEKDIRIALDKLWERKPIKLNWNEFEDLMVEILNAPIDATDTRRACREALDAFTRRGHFDPDSYFTTEPKG